MHTWRFQVQSTIDFHSNWAAAWEAKRSGQHWARPPHPTTRQNFQVRFASRKIGKTRQQIEDLRCWASAFRVVRVWCRDGAPLITGGRSLQSFRLDAVLGCPVERARSAAAGRV